MADLYAVIPEYSTGPDVRGIELEPDAEVAAGSAHLLQLDADEAGIPVVYRVYALTEVTR